MRVSQDMVAIVEPLVPSLRRYARSLLRNQAGADDLVQDCLERVVSRWHQRRPDADARTWVFTILHNLAINRLKQDARRGIHVAVDEQDERFLARPPEQEDGLHHRAILDALAQLSEEQRGVLLLVSVEDLTYAETAAVLGVPIGTVMSRLSRARHRLAQIIEHKQPARTVPLRSVK